MPSNGGVGCRGEGVWQEGEEKSEHYSISAYAQGNLDVSVTALSGIKGSVVLRQYPLSQSRTQGEGMAGISH